MAPRKDGAAPAESGSMGRPDGVGIRITERVVSQYADGKLRFESSLTLQNNWNQRIYGAVAQDGQRA